jgi:AcrR family transcriptional regulator
MSRGVRLDRATVVETAAALMDERGLEGFTLARLAARLGIRSQSIYAHVDGLDNLRRELALLSLGELSHRLGRSAMGRTGRDALHALAHTHAEFAVERPGLYACSLRSPDGDGALAQGIKEVTDPWHSVLASFGLPPSEIVHYHRALWAAIHGFVTLRHQGLMTRAASPDRSFTMMIDAFADALDNQRTASRDRSLRDSQDQRAGARR